MLAEKDGRPATSTACRVARRRLKRPVDEAGSGEPRCLRRFVGDAQQAFVDRDAQPIPGVNRDP
jgi:hypothetical protein